MPAVLLTAGLLVQLAPIVLLPMVLTQDGPAHVYGAWVLVHHRDDDAVGAALRAHFTIDLSPVPNMLTTLLLAGLLSVLAPDAAEKVVVAGFVVLLVAGLGYAARGVDRRAGWLAAAALPLAGGQLVVYGFYNFCWGIGLALLAIGVALRRRAGWRAGHTLVAALLLTLTWSAHLLPWAVAVSVVGGLGAGRWVVAVRAGVRPWAAAARWLLPPLAAVLPGVVLTVAYLARGGQQQGAATGWAGIDRVWWLLTLYRPLVSGSWWELVPAVAVAVVLGGLALLALRTPPDPGGTAVTGDPARATARADRIVLGAATVAAMVALPVMPERLGTAFGFLPERWSWFPPLLLVLFCATRPPRRPAVQRAAVGVLVLAATAAAVLRLPTELADQRQAAAVSAMAEAIPPGATFAVLWYSRHQAALAPLPNGPSPWQHLSSRLGTRIGAIDVGYYEAVYPYFQVRFSADPSVRQLIDPGLFGLEKVPPRVDLSAAGNGLTYVVVVGLDRVPQSLQQTDDVLTDLRAHYVQVAESAPSDDVTVWRLHNATGG